MKYGKTITMQDARASWNDYQIELEEVPVKGAHKAKLRRTVINTSYAVITMRKDAYLIENLLMDVERARGDGFVWPSIKTYDEAAKALGAALGALHARPEHEQVRRIGGVAHHEDKRSYLEVRPIGVEDRVVECRDFRLSAKWSTFSAYAPHSDFSQPDPHYTMIEARSPGAARKLYKLVDRLVAEGYKFGELAWHDFSNFLGTHGVSYEYHHSQWR